MTEIKDGDYFSYSWKVGKGPSTDSYWCRDRHCVACTDKNGQIVLIDTFNYWEYNQRGEKENEIFTFQGLDREYSRYMNQESFDLDFICNLHDYELIDSWKKDDYDDVIFVGFQLTKRWATRKGSEPSKTAILKKLQGKLSDYEAEKRSAEWGIERITKEIDEILKSV